MEPLNRNFVSLRAPNGYRQLSQVSWWTLGSSILMIGIVNEDSPSSSRSCAVAFDCVSLDWALVVSPLTEGGLAPTSDEWVPYDPTPEVLRQVFIIVWNELTRQRLNVTSATSGYMLRILLQAITDNRLIPSSPPVWARLGFTTAYATDVDGDEIAMDIISPICELMLQGGSLSLPEVSALVTMRSGWTVIHMDDPLSGGPAGGFHSRTTAAASVILARRSSPQELPPLAVYLMIMASRNTDTAYWGCQYAALPTQVSWGEAPRPEDRAGLPFAQRPIAIWADVATTPGIVDPLEPTNFFARSKPLADALRAMDDGTSWNVSEDYELIMGRPCSWPDAMPRLLVLGNFQVWDDQADIYVQAETPIMRDGVRTIMRAACLHPLLQNLWIPGPEVVPSDCMVIDDYDAINDAYVVHAAQWSDLWPDAAIARQQFYRKYHSSVPFTYVPSAPAWHCTRVNGELTMGVGWSSFDVAEDPASNDDSLMGQTASSGVNIGGHPFIYYRPRTFTDERVRLWLTWAFRPQWLTPSGFMNNPDQPHYYSEVPTLFGFGLQAGYVNASVEYYSRQDWEISAEVTPMDPLHNHSWFRWNNRWDSQLGRYFLSVAAVKALRFTSETAPDYAIVEINASASAPTRNASRAVDTEVPSASVLNRVLHRVHLR